MGPYHRKIGAKTILVCLSVGLSVCLSFQTLEAKLEGILESDREWTPLEFASDEIPSFVFSVGGRIRTQDLPTHCAHRGYRLIYGEFWKMTESLPHLESAQDDNPTFVFSVRARIRTQDLLTHCAHRGYRLNYGEFWKMTESWPHLESAQDDNSTFVFSCQG